MTTENEGKTKVHYRRWEDRHPELFAFFREHNPEMFIHCLDAKGEPNDFGKLALEHIRLKKTFDGGEIFSMGHGSSVRIIGSLSDQAFAITRLNNGSLGLDD